MIPDGVEPSLPVCGTGVVPFDHGTELTEVGVEPLHLTTAALAFTLPIGRRQGLAGIST